MKTNCISLILAVVAMAASCQYQDIESPALEIEEGLTEMTFPTSIPASSKTSVSGNKVSWEIGDKVAVYSISSTPRSTSTETANDFNAFVFEADATGATSTISGSIVVSESGKYLALYPAYVENEYPGNNDYLRINYNDDTKGKIKTRTLRHYLPAEQSGDGRESVLVAEGNETDGFQFTIMTSMFRFVIPDALDGQLSKVEIAAPGSTISGQVWMNVDTKNVGEASGSRSSSVYFENENGIAAGTYYLVALPVTMAAGFTITTTDKTTGEKFNSRSYSGPIDLLRDQNYANAKTPASKGGIIINLKELSSEPDAEEEIFPYPYPETTPSFAPIIANMHVSDANKFDNLTCDASTGLVFKGKNGWSEAGCAINISGMSGATVASATTSDQSQKYMTVKNVREGGYFEYVIPVKQTISGDVEFVCSVNSNKFSDISADSDPFIVKWSADGSNWNDASRIVSKTGKYQSTVPFQKDYGYSTITVEFTLPTAVNSGNIYVRFISQHTATNQSATIRINNGFYLAPRTVNVDYSQDPNVLVSESFDADNYAANPVIGKFVGTFSSPNFADDYVMSTGWTKDLVIPAGGSNNYLRSFRGCAGFVAGAASSAYKCTKGIVTPALPLDGASEVLVTFKAAPYVTRTATKDIPPLAVTVEGAGKVGELFYDEPLTESTAYSWHTFWCVVSGADVTTKVRVGTPASGYGDRFLIDDIVVSKM